MSERKRGSRIGRIVQYFREADADEARVTFQLVAEAIEQRNGAGKKVQRRRRARTNIPVAQIEQGGVLGEDRDV